ncbi:MAG: hypothetical protein GTO14_13850 [Anaerolineales bacterium]|nr:hypothetical protein [Anaerolineales bacterium]
MKPQSIIIKYHRIILYLTTLGLAAYGIMAIINPDVLASGFNRFTEQDWGRFQIDNQVVAAYVTLLWRLIGGFNLAVGLTLTFVVWRWLLPGSRWAWITLLLGTLMAYLSPMILDLTVRSIEVFEVIEFLLFGLFVITMLFVRQEYFTQPDARSHQSKA